MENNPLQAATLTFLKFYVLIYGADTLLNNLVIQKTKTEIIGLSVLNSKLESPFYVRECSYVHSRSHYDFPV